MSKISVCAYCRVSTDSKDQENSFENQKSYFKREINKNENYKLYKIYADKGITGTSLSKREQFNQMLFDGGLNIIDVQGEPTFRIDKDRKPLFNRIIVKNTSRFARNVEAIQIIRKLRGNGVFIDFLDIDLTTEQEDFEFVLNLFLNFDQQDSIDKSKKVRFGQFEGAKKGNIFVNTKLFGYQYNVDSKELEIIEKEAEIIKIIFGLYVNANLGIRKIIDYLDENGFKTREGNSFAKSTIKKILSNEKYCGVLVRNKFDTGTIFNKKKTPKLRPEHEWIVHEDRVPAIIDKELFQNAQKMRKSKAGKQRGINHGNSEFAGLIKCTQCGASYTRNNDKGRVFYNCSTKKTKGTKDCDNVNVQEYSIEEIIFGLANGGLFHVFLSNKDVQIKQLKEIKERMKQSIDKDSVNEVLNKRDELERLEKQKSKLLDLYLEDTFDKKQLSNKSGEIDERIGKINFEIKELSKEQSEIFDDIEEVNQIILKIESEGIKEAFTREEIIDSIKTINVERSAEDSKKPTLRLQLKAFDVINKYVGKYEDLKLGKRTDTVQLMYLKE
ncbi:recombinase family protein [Robertmurraya sp. GLU-23]